VPVQEGNIWESVQEWEVSQEEGSMSISPAKGNLKHRGRDGFRIGRGFRIMRIKRAYLGHWDNEGIVPDSVGGVRASG